MSDNEHDMIVTICIIGIAFGYLFYLRNQTQQTEKFHEQMLDEYRLNIARMKEDNENH